MAGTTESALLLRETVLSKRIITALVAIPLIAGSIQWGGQKLFFIIILITAGTALIEFFAMSMTRPQWFRVIALACGVCLLWGVQHYRQHLAFESPLYQSGLFGILMTIPLFATGSALLFLYVIFPRKYFLLRQPMATLFGVLYISLFLSYLILLYGGNDGKGWIFLLLILLWCNDSGAYLIGRMLGTHPLSPLVSPGKTVEGACGGILFSLIAAVFTKSIFVDALSIGDALQLSLLIAVSGQVGDLCESALKRHFSVKDSGVLLPGHGGMLDRIDSLLFAAPLTYYYKMLML